MNIVKHIIEHEILGIKPGATGSESSGSVEVSGNIITNLSCDLSVEVDDLVYVSDVNYVSPAIANDISTSLGIGFVVDKPQPTICNVAVAGDITYTRMGLAPNTQYFMSDTSPGDIQDTPPVASGSFLAKVGLGISTDRLLISIDPMVIERG